MTNIIEAIRIPKNFFTLSGHWPEEKTTIIQRMLFFLEILFILSLLAELTKHFDDYEILSEHLSITISPTSYLIKLIIFKFKSDAVQNLISLIKLKEFNDCPKHLRYIIRHTVKYSNILGNGYQLLCFVSILLYSLVPVFTKADLPVKFSYNIGNLKPIIYAFQVVGMVSTASNNSSMDILAMSLMRICAAQIEILNRKIIGLSDEYENCRSDHINEKLKNCVKHHVKIIRYHKILDKVFSMIILTQYATSAVVICNLGFQLVHVDPMSLQFVRITVYFITMMIQLAMYCWFGNEIILKSSAIRDACYEFKWFESDLDTRKILTIIMERSKKPLVLKVGKFSILSLQSYTSVIRTSYSYFALMQTLYRKGQN